MRPPIGCARGLQRRRYRIAGGRSGTYSQDERARSQHASCVLLPKPQAGATRLRRRIVHCIQSVRTRKGDTKTGRDFFTRCDSIGVGGTHGSSTKHFRPGDANHDLVVAVNLTLGGYFDIAVRDVVLSIGAFTLARLLQMRDEVAVGEARPVPVQHRSIE